MTAIKNIKIDFVKRTKELLENNYSDFKKNDREVTFLLNCLLGLIISVSELEKKSKISNNEQIDGDFFNCIPEKIGFIINSLPTPDLLNDSNFTTQIGHKTDLKSQNKIWFVNKLRNGIAHQNIEDINEDDNWVGLKLWNENNIKVKDFEIVFTIEDLYKMAIQIATEYLQKST